MPYTSRWRSFPLGVPSPVRLGVTVPYKTLHELDVAVRTWVREQKPAMCAHVYSATGGKIPKEQMRELVLADMDAVITINHRSRCENTQCKIKAANAQPPLPPSPFGAETPPTASTARRPVTGPPPPLPPYPFD